MKNHYCEKAQGIAVAVRSGTLPEDLRDHIAICKTCAEVMLVTSLLHQEIVPATAKLNPPDAALIWRRAQDAARRKALTKATAPIRIARMWALLVALASTPWLLTSMSMPSWLLDFGLQRLGVLTRALSGALTSTTLLGVGASLICMLLSSWYVLRQD